MLFYATFCSFPNSVINSATPPSALGKSGLTAQVGDVLDNDDWNPLFQV
jgi:hypothetical protein